MRVVRIHHFEDGFEPLPCVCLVCGEHVEEHDPIPHNFYHTSEYAYYLLFLSPLVFAVIAWATTKKRRILTPMCENHRWYWIQRMGLRLMFLFSFFSLFFTPSILTLVGKRDFLQPITIANLISMAISGYLLFNSVRSDEISPDSLRICNVHDKFYFELDALREACNGPDFRGVDSVRTVHDEGDSPFANFQ